MPSQIEILIWIIKNSGRSLTAYAEPTDSPKEETGGFWNWIKRTAASMFNAVKNGVKRLITDPLGTLSDIWDWIKRNKYMILIGVGTLLSLPLMIGFAPAGIVAGSLAAAWQSSIGAVAAGSAFATLQSLGMSGVLTGIGLTMTAIGRLAELPKLLRCLKTPGTPLPPEFVDRFARATRERHQPSPQPPPTTQLPFPIPTNGTPLWKWLAGVSGPPFELSDTGVLEEEARTMVLALLACDEELPALLSTADITVEERNSILGAIANLPTEGGGDDGESLQGRIV